MTDKSRKIFVFDLSKQHAAMPPGYKSEIDTTELWNDAEKAQYLKCIGKMQWDVALGRIYIMYATIVLYLYCPDPHKGQISNIQHLYGYLKKYASTSIKLNI